MSRDYEMTKFIRQNLQEYNNKFRTTCYAHIHAHQVEIL